MTKKSKNCYQKEKNQIWVLVTIRLTVLLCARTIYKNYVIFSRCGFDIQNIYYTWVAAKILGLTKKEGSWAKFDQLFLNAVTFQANIFSAVLLNCPIPTVLDDLQGPSKSGTWRHFFSQNFRYEDFSLILRTKNSRRVSNL